MNSKELCKRLNMMMTDSLEALYDDGITVRCKEDGFQLWIPTTVIESELETAGPMEEFNVVTKLLRYVNINRRNHLTCLKMSPDDVKNIVTFKLNPDIDTLPKSNILAVKLLGVAMTFQLGDYAIRENDLTAWDIDLSTLRKSASENTINKYSGTTCVNSNDIIPSEMLKMLPTDARGALPFLIATKEKGPEFVLFPGVMEDVMKKYEIQGFFLCDDAILGISDIALFDDRITLLFITAFMPRLISMHMYTYDKDRNGIMIVK